MIELLQLTLHIMASLFKPRAKLVVEILVRRQQLNVLRRQVSKRPRLSNADRIRSKNSSQVRLAKDQYPIKALASHGADQTLHIRILPRRSWRDRSVAGWAVFQLSLGGENEGDKAASLLVRALSGTGIPSAQRYS